MIILHGPRTTPRWQAMKQQLQDTIDGMGKPIDAGILETCIVLNLHGFTTDMSCEGHLGADPPAPWIRFTNDEAREYENEAAALYREGRIFDDDIVAEVRRTGIVPREQQHYLNQAHARERQARLALGSDQLRLLEHLNRFMQGRAIPNDQRLIVYTAVAATFQMQSQGALAASTLIPELEKQRLQSYQEEMQAFTMYLISCL